MRLGEAFNNFGDTFKTAGKQVIKGEPAHAYGKASGSLIGKTIDGAFYVGSLPFRAAYAVTKPVIKTSVGVAAYVAERPLVWSTNIAEWGVGKTGNFFAGNRKLALGVTAVGAVAGAGAYMAHRAQKKTEQSFMDQMATLQAQQPQLLPPVANTYNYPIYKDNPAITAEDVASMEARLAAKRDTAGHAASVANRAEGATVQTEL